MLRGIGILGLSAHSDVLFSASAACLGTRGFRPGAPLGLILLCYVGGRGLSDQVQRLN
jgi:hypothetical protein